MTNVGVWWGTEQIENSKVERIQQSADIDTVGISEIDKTAVIGECKFKNERIDKNVYDTLIRRASRIIGKYKITKYLFFSLSGFTEWFDSISDDNVILITLEDMYN